MADNGSVVAASPFDKEKAAVAYSIMDTLAAVFYFVYTLALILLSKRLSIQVGCLFSSAHYGIRLHTMGNLHTNNNLIL